jgi:hypothetical protein
MQNLISLALTDQDLNDLDTSLGTLRRVMTKFVVLRPEDRIEVKKMGPKSRHFCEGTLAVLDNNRQIVPPNLALDEALADKRALDLLRPRLQQLRQLMETADDTEMALGSDMMAVAHEGYRLLAVPGKSEALKRARRELSVRFARQPRNPGEGTDPAA